MDNKLPEGFDPLLLDNQICFALYVCSKEIIRRYTPLLEPLGLTYTSYIILMCLWEHDNISVKDLGQRLYLDSGTLTPVLKKMEQQEFVVRSRSETDQRSVYIRLTEKGRDFRSKCLHIPQQMACCNLIDFDNAVDLLNNLHAMMDKMK